MPYGKGTYGKKKGRPNKKGNGNGNSSKKNRRY